jgi:hypothetical protein
MSKLTQPMNRRELLWIAIPGLSLILGGCSDQRRRGHKRRTLTRKIPEDTVRHDMLKKLRKGYEGAQKKKIKEEYGSTLGAATKRVRKGKKLRVRVD